MRLPSSWDRIGRRLTSSEAKMAVQSAEAEAVEQVEQYRHGRRIRPKPMMRCSCGRKGRRLTSSEATMAVRSAEAEAPDQLEQYRHGRRIRPKPMMRCSWGP